MSALAIAFACVAAPCPAHVHWQQTNGVMPETVAIYHFDQLTTAVASPAPGLPVGLGLTVSSGAQSLTHITDTPGTIFEPGALALHNTQTMRSTDAIAQLDGDLTIECWFKWTPGVTSSTLELGLQSGAKIMVARDTTTPANDRFGVSATHGSFRSAPDFPNWIAVGEEEAGLDEWRHLALAIHSTGIHYDSLAGHDVYSTGTVGRLYLNGHETGFGTAMDLSGLKVHDTSQITITIRGGSMAVDEFAIWKRDWTGNGSVSNPFANGRGPASVTNWLEYHD
jgi:hypothetical protein